MTSRIAKAAVAVALAALAIVVSFRGGLPGLHTESGAGRPEGTPAVTAPSTQSRPEGWVDNPATNIVFGSRINIAGWAVDKAGIRGVEVRLDGRPFAARYGIARPDVARLKPGFPDSIAGGFDFEGDFAPLSLQRHEIEVVAFSQSGQSSVLARKSLVPDGALSLWRRLLDQKPSLASRSFTFLMMTSGVGEGAGAREIDTIYQPLLSRTMQVGMAVPILYLRTTRGEARDWVFDPEFDLSRKCENKPVADDNLAGVIRHAIAHRLPVQFILNGGIWADATCDIPAWDINDQLEKDVDNCQWTAHNEVFPDEYLKNMTGSSQSPELGRSLTYNVYAEKVRHYKRRNLQAAARIIAQFAREHPDLFVGVSLDADTYMNPFFEQKGLAKIFDYNPGMLKQFRHWLAGDGPYAGRPEPGAPNLSRYRRERPLTLAAANRMAGRQWKSWDEVEPPRRFPGMKGEASAPGEPPIWGDAWYQEWQVFRQHVIGLHYDELSQWTHEAGIPSDRIFSAQGFIAPQPGFKPFAIRIASRGHDYDTSGVSVEGAIPRSGHLGVVIYGKAAENDLVMETRHSMFATFARMDPGWAVVEYNSTDLERPTVQPTYAQAYRSFRDMFNFGVREISAMAWNGSNGLFADEPGYVPYTAWRNTPAERAMQDFLVTHADLPRGALLWTFGSPRHSDDDGWSTGDSALASEPGVLAVMPRGNVATLDSPADQVIRPTQVDRVILGVADPKMLARVEIHARVAPDAPWQRIAGLLTVDRLQRTEAGVTVPLEWPKQWVGNGTVVEQIRMRLELSASAPERMLRLNRVGLYPRGV